MAGNETLEALRHRQRLEARAAEEEDLMVRVPLSKEQKKQLKVDRRVNLSGAAMMNDFADDVADLVGVSSLPVCHLLCWLQSRDFLLSPTVKLDTMSCRSAWVHISPRTA